MAKHWPIAVAKHWSIAVTKHWPIAVAKIWSVDITQPPRVRRATGLWSGPGCYSLQPWPGLYWIKIGQSFMVQPVCVLKIVMQLGKQARVMCMEFLTGVPGSLL